MINRGGADWCVFQIGAREHYAIPRALDATGAKYHLFTDYWTNHSDLLPAPGPLRQRCHPALGDENISSFKLGYLALEARQKVRGRSSWQHIEARNAWFQNVAVEAFEKYLDTCDTPPVVFAYSYAALDILKVAKSYGCNTLLGQIDPGPVEFHLVEHLHNLAGHELTDRPTPGYWEMWRQECDIADQIIVNSRWSRSALEKVGIDPGRIREVPLVYEGASETGQLKNEPFKPPLQVLFLGQVVLRKGILELAEAIRMLEGKSVGWTIVGDGEAWLTDELRKLPQTRVTGAVSRAEVGQFYDEADVFILPTHSDGFALTQLEAAAHWLPIICSRHCGDVVEQGVTGFLLDEVSANEIARAVSVFLEDPEKLGRFSRQIGNRKAFTLADLGETLMQLAGGPGR